MEWAALPGVGEEYLRSRSYAGKEGGAPHRAEEERSTGSSHYQDRASQHQDGEVESSEGKHGIPAGVADDGRLVLRCAPGQRSGLALRRRGEDQAPRDER